MAQEDALTHRGTFVVKDDEVVTFQMSMQDMNQYQIQYKKKT